METVLLISQAHMKISEMDKLLTSLPEKITQKFKKIFCIADKMNSKKQTVNGANDLQYIFIPNESNSVKRLAKTLEQFMTLTIATNINEPIVQILKTLNSHRILAGLDDKGHVLYIKNSQKFLKETTNLNEIDPYNMFTKTVDQYVNIKSNVTTDINALKEKSSSESISSIINEVADLLGIRDEPSNWKKGSNGVYIVSKSKPNELKKDKTSVRHIEFKQEVNEQKVLLDGYPIGSIDPTLKFVVILQDLYENYNSIEKCISADELDDRAYQKSKKLKSFQKKKVKTESEKGLIGKATSDLPNEIKELKRLRENKSEFFKMLPDLKFLNQYLKLSKTECYFDSMGRVEITFG